MLEVVLHRWVRRALESFPDPYRSWTYRFYPLMSIARTQKKIRFEFPQPRMGIYVIKFRHTDLRYIGSSTHIQRRVNDHFSQLRAGTPPNPRFQHYFDRLGERALTWGILEECPEKQLTRREQYHLNQFQPQQLVNLNLIAKRPPFD